MKAKYEAIIVISVKNGDEKIEELSEKFKALIEANGTLESVDVWGKRKLAYEIKDYTEGNYVVVNFTGDNATVDALDYVYKVSDTIIRSIVIREEE